MCSLTPALGQPVVHLLLESAAVYCACLIVTLATYLSNNTGAYFILDVTPPIVVRVFLMIESLTADTCFDVSHRV
jgi:hypothetical protein